MIVKVCGMTTIENLKAITAFQPEYFGFIFYEKSPRAIKIESLPYFDGIDKIGVFVNATHDFILKKQKQYNLNGIQLHGEEDVSYIKDLKTKIPQELKILKAISVRNSFDFGKINTYETFVDLIILDTKTKLRGGSGQQFDWSLLKYYDANIPFLLSGGVSVNNLDEILKLDKQHQLMIGVDINSKFEMQPGIKNAKRVNTFLKKLKSKS